MSFLKASFGNERTLRGELNAKSRKARIFSNGLGGEIPPEGEGKSTTNIWGRGKSRESLGKSQQCDTIENPGWGNFPTEKGKKYLD